ncbi:RHS repeat domain-containing protein, partial [Klebsiella aerogenes]
PLALLTQEAGRKESWHYHCDPNGAPVRLTSLQGEIVWSEKTGVWGEKGEIYADRISNPLRFQGQYFDAETGLHYNRHRYYDPEIAGFISQDPIGLAGGLNVYQYAPNPLGWVDPWGLAKSCGGTTKFYRSMSHEDFEYLRTTGKLRGTSETFISPRRAFSENYDGVLVRFYLKNDALSELKSIGVKDSAVLTSITYPDMPDVGKGWKETSAFFKAEGEQINIGLGKGKALDIFNQGIQRFERLN